MEEWDLGDYRVIERVGEGGMAVVYLAHPKDVPDHRVILKELKNPRHGKRFKKEASHLARLKGHPNICGLYHYFNRGERIIIVTEYVEGATLTQLIKSQEKISIGLCLKLTCDVLNALKYAHEKAIYHRDIKPSNIMVDVLGNIKVIDFGIAKSEYDPDLTEPGVFCGTPHFSSPEQFNLSAKINWAQADIYALGTTLYLLTTKRLPHPQEDLRELVQAKLKSDPDTPSSINPDIPPELDEIILKALSRHAPDRYQSAEEMQYAVNELIQTMLTSTVDFRETIETVLEQQPQILGRDRPAVIDKRQKIFQRLSLLKTVSFLLVIATAGIVLDTKFNLFSGGESPPKDSLEVIDGGAQEPVVIVPPSGVVMIDAVPYASLYLDDSLIVRDASQYRLECDTGQHIVQLINQAAVDSLFLETVTVSESSETRLQHTFVFDSSATLHLSISPSGDVYFDDSLIKRNCTDETFATNAGLYIVRVENRRARVPTQIDTVTLRPRQTLARSYEFEMLPDSGEVVIGSKPFGASVYIDEQLQAYPTPFTFTLDSGDHHIRVVLSSPSMERETTLTVQPGTTQRYIAKFEE